MPNAPLEAPYYQCFHSELLFAHRIELAEAVFEHAQLATLLETLENDRKAMKLPGDMELGFENTSELFASTQISMYTPRKEPGFGAMKCLTVFGHGSNPGA